MGVCSYCYTYQRDECFGWSEAQGCKIAGPDDPKRLRNKITHDTHRAADLRREADKIEADAAKRVAGIRAQATGLEQGCEATALRLAAGQAEATAVE